MYAHPSSGPPRVSARARAVPAVPGSIGFQCPSDCARDKPDRAGSSGGAYGSRGAPTPYPGHHVRLVTWGFMWLRARLRHRSRTSVVIGWVPRLPLQHRCAWATLPGSVGDPPYARGTSSSTHEASGCRWASSVWSIHSPQRWQSGWVARTWARMACRRLVLRLSTSGVHRGCGGVRLVRRGVGRPIGQPYARAVRAWPGSRVRGWNASGATGPLGSTVAHARCVLNTPRPLGQRPADIRRYA